MTTTLLPRPALADRHWTEDAACAGTGVPADLWAADTGLARAAAVHVCHTHCPVLRECALEAQVLAGTPNEYRSMVVGGRAYDQYGDQVRSRYADIRCPLCTVMPEPWPDLVGRRGGNYGDQSLAPCGTTAAYDRHRRRGEQACGPCRAAHNAATTASKRARRARAGAQ